MPDWIKDENTWKKAIKAFKKQYDKEPKDSSDYAIVTSIYKKMGGKISTEAKEMAKMYKFAILKEANENDTKINLQTSGENNEENSTEDVTTVYTNKGEEKMNYMERLRSMSEAIKLNKNYEVIKPFKAQKESTGRMEQFSKGDEQLEPVYSDKSTVEFMWFGERFAIEKNIFERSTKLQ